MQNKCIKRAPVVSIGANAVQAVRAVAGAADCLGFAGSDIGAEAGAEDGLTHVRRQYFKGKMYIAAWHSRNCRKRELARNCCQAA